MAKRLKPVGKMTDDELIAEHRAIDKRFFSLRRRYVEAEMSRRGLTVEEQR